MRAQRAGRRPPPVPSGETRHGAPRWTVASPRAVGAAAPAAAAQCFAITLLVAITVLGTGSWLVGRQILTARAVEADRRSAPVAAAVGLPRGPRFVLNGPRPGWATAGRSGCTRWWKRPAATTNSWCGSRRSASMAPNPGRGAAGSWCPARFLKARAVRDYAEAFRDEGLGAPVRRPRGRSRRESGLPMGPLPTLVAALDDWAVCAPSPGPARLAAGDMVADRADPDTSHDRVRRPAVWRDGKALAELAGAAHWRGSPYRCCWRWANGCAQPGKTGSAFSRVREQYPEHFWANFLALWLHDGEGIRGGDPTPALPITKALEIRPEAVAVQRFRRRPV